MKPFIVPFVITLIVTATICSCDNGNKGIVITDAHSALTAHKAFLEKASRTKKTDIQELIALSKEWFVLSDTLSHHVQPDSGRQVVYDKKSI